MKKETLEDAAENYSKITLNKKSLMSDKQVNGFIAGAKWAAEQNRWKTVDEETPPSNIELLVQSPSGTVHLSSWREGYSIFTCQAKTESSFDWKWKTI
jgi:hypothetical protein